MDAVPNSAERQTVLVVGATGALGGRVVDALLARDKRVRALVREGTDPRALAAKGVEIARGDMLDPASLDRAMTGVDGVVTAAAGYTRRRRGDSLEKVDNLGNRNLVDAAKGAGVKRFVFTSILTCDQTPQIPHFWQKKVIEDYLEARGVPFVSLRPGAFLGGYEMLSKALRKDRFFTFGRSDVLMTFIHPDDVARCLAMALDEPRAVGKRIDLGADRAVSADEVVAVLSKLTGRPFRVRGLPLPFRLFFWIGGFFSSMVNDMTAMLDYFGTGKYVADTKLQAEFFGPVPTVEDSVRRLMREAGVATEPA